jgi:hypothetical protein
MIGNIHTSDPGGAMLHCDFPRGLNGPRSADSKPYLQQFLMAIEWRTNMQCTQLALDMIG